MYTHIRHCDRFFVKAHRNMIRVKSRNRGPAPRETLPAVFGNSNGKYYTKSAVGVNEYAGAREGSG